MHQYIQSDQVRRHQQKNWDFDTHPDHRKKIVKGVRRVEKQRFQKELKDVCTD